MKIKIKIVATIIVVLTISMVSCGLDAEKNSEEHNDHEAHGPKGIVVLNVNQREVLKLKLGTFQMRNLTTVVKINGQLEISPDSRADITSLIGGNVKSIKVFHGDKVSKGQTLAVLEHPDFISLQESYSEFAHNLKYLEQDYYRQKDLYESNAGSSKSFQKAKADYFTAKAKLQGLRSRLLLLNLSPEDVEAGKISNEIKLVSPISGYVNKVNVRLGTYVGPQDKLFEITDHNAIHADFLVYEKDVSLVEEGQIIHFTVANREDEELTANVFAIGKEFESNTRAVYVHARINESTKGLIPGMYITGHLHTDTNYTQTLPNDAIVLDGMKSYIFVLVIDEHEGHSHDNGHSHDVDDNKSKSYRIVEVLVGKKDDGFTEVKLVDSLPKNTKIVMNVAYYLLADMKKEETEHVH